MLHEDEFINKTVKIIGVSEYCETGLKANMWYYMLLQNIGTSFIDVCNRISYSKNN